MRRWRSEQFKTLLISLPLRYEFGSEFVSNSLSELNNQSISHTNRERIRTDPICEFSATVHRRWIEYFKTVFISLRRRYEVGSEFVSNSLSELNNQLISQTNRERIRTDPICEFSATVHRRWTEYFKTVFISLRRRYEFGSSGCEFALRIEIEFGPPSAVVRLAQSIREESFCEFAANSHSEIRKYFAKRT